RRRLDVDPFELRQDAALVDNSGVIDGERASAGGAECRQDLSSTRGTVDFNSPGDGRMALNWRRIGQAVLHRRDNWCAARALNRVHPRDELASSRALPPTEPFVCADDERTTSGWNHHVAR